MLCAHNASNRNIIIIRHRYIAARVKDNNIYFKCTQQKKRKQLTLRRTKYYHQKKIQIGTSDSQGAVNMQLT